MVKTYRLEEGMPVIGSAGEKVGEVGKVVVGQESREARFFTIEKGLFHTDHLVPREAIRRVDDRGQAHVGLTNDQIESLPVYDGDPPTTEEARQAYQVIGARRGEAYILPRPYPQLDALENDAAVRPGVVVPAESYHVPTREEREREGYRTEWTYGPIPPDEGARR